MKRTLRAAIAVASVAVGIGIVAGPAAAESEQPTTHIYVKVGDCGTTAEVIAGLGGRLQPSVINEFLRTHDCASTSPARSVSSSSDAEAS